MLSVKSSAARAKLAAAAVCVTVGAAGIVQAAPYASGITESAGTVSYYLNESADTVTIYRDGTPEVLTNLPKGPQSFARMGATLYQIQVSKAAPAGYTQTATNSTQNNFELPRGVAVNANPSLGGAPNPYFGRVYVSNGRETNSAAGRTMQSGIYLLNPDFSDAVGQGNAARKGGIPMLTATSTPADTTGADPFRVQVGPDNRLYVTSFLDTHAGLWSTDPDVTSNVEVLDNTGRSSIGLNSTSGNVTDVVVQGTGASRVLYTTDEDINAGQKGIYQYNIGNTTTLSGAPTTLFSDPDNKIQNGTQSLARSTDGTFWVTQVRGGGADTLPSLMQVSDTGTVLWDSLTLSSSGTSLNDPLVNAQAVAFDPVNDVLAIATAQSTTGSSGKIFIFDDDSKTILATIPFATSGAATNTDVVFDAAGNMYVTNRSAERLLVWSPGGTSVFTTDSLGSFYAGAATPEPTGLALLGIAGLGALARRRRA